MSELRHVGAGFRLTPSGNESAPPPSVTPLAKSWRTATEGRRAAERAVRIGCLIDARTARRAAVVAQALTKRKDADGFSAYGQNIGPTDIIEYALNHAFLTLPADERTEAEKELAS